LHEDLVHPTIVAKKQFHIVAIIQAIILQAKISQNKNCNLLHFNNQMCKSKLQVIKKGKLILGWLEHKENDSQELNMKSWSQMANNRE
jgi:hypothetical protein